MMGKIKSLANNVAGNLVASIILNLLVGLGAPLAIVWSSVKSLISKIDTGKIPQMYWAIFIGGVIVALICIVLTAYHIAKKINKPHFPKIQSDIRCRSAISELFFEDRENVICSREVDLEVVCEKMESIKKQFTWTGTEYRGTVLEKSDGQYSLVDYQRKKPPHGYEVKFDTIKYRGDIVKYKTKTELGDLNHEMKPFFTHLVKSPTDSLELSVTAPKGLLKDVTYTICADMMGELPISKPEHIRAKTVGNLETFSYRITKPNLLYNYRLEWKF